MNTFDEMQAKAEVQPTERELHAQLKDLLWATIAGAKKAEQHASNPEVLALVTCQLYCVVMTLKCV